jgi:hypothetical protein
MAGSPGSGLFGQGGGFGSNTVSGIGSAAADLIQGQTTEEADTLKSQQDAAEAQTYQLEAQQAGVQGALTTASEQRQIYQTSGATESEIASSGFQASGTASSIIRSNAQQGALALATTQENTNLQVTTADIMANAATQASSEEAKMANQARTDSYITAGISGAAAVASLF